MLLTTPLVLLSNIITVPRFRKHPAFLYLSWLIIDYRGDSGRPANRGTVRGKGAGEDQPGDSVGLRGGGGPTRGQQEVEGGQQSADR